ncbi:hypothetical protein [Phytomonospora endophytica]|uniref:Uncharacterized protein n=1 Tax=Phytomonospora endophytica TaxID=714109 RepID=A0A841FCD2_9ACTN|nr:hypothetical protein [Phytomonospora endophytica]MBB6033926.1 hypothetical protein [Phytomonospora endophytica]GIG64553.1 hypothetical protein Pen01_08480 [Phytomonospora endophytica]
MTRPTPLLGDLTLDAVQHIEHLLDGGHTSTPITGLDGELQQRTGRPSHRIVLRGEIFGADAADRLGGIQTAAAEGAELTFAADIATALELQKVVVTRLHVVAVAGHTDRYGYELHLAESPELPPPAELSGFGGLDGLGGLGDLGFGDLGGVLDDIGELAGQVAGAVDQAMAAVEAVQALAALADLGLPDPSGLLAPLSGPVTAVGEAAAVMGEAATALGEAFGGS